MLKSYKFLMPSIILICALTISFLILANSNVSADVVDNVSITVPVSCNITSDLDTPHTAIINPGQYKEDIGTTTFKVLCNDNTGYALYAIGYSNEEYGNTNLLPTNTSNPSIATGLATSGNTSNWAMKLTPVTEQSSGTSQPYVPTIESDTNGSFSNYHIVPEEYTKVATFTSTTDFTIGSSLTSTYRVFIQGMQPADTYQGKVKYTLVHPNDANPPEAPAITAFLEEGRTICDKMLKLTIPEDEYWGCADNTSEVSAFVRSNTLPSSFTPTSDNTISLPESEAPVYIFYDSTTNAINYYSRANKIYLNSQSNNMFYLFSSLVDISGLSSFDASSVVNMSYMFHGDYLRNGLDAISSWDVSNVTNMDGLFNGTGITDIDALGSWNTSSVTNMSGIFHAAYSLNNISGAANWDTSNVTNMADMFCDTSITDLDAISSWDTSSVTNMAEMFAAVDSLTDVSGAANWNTSNVTDIYYMFNGANNIDATVLNNWNVSKVTDKTDAFTCPVAKRPSWY